MANRYPPWDWRNKTTQEALAVYNKRIIEIEEQYIKAMAKHIQQIGRMKASDITRLNQMRIASRNINEVQKQIAKLADISDEELQEVFEKTCEFEGNDFLHEVVKAGNITWSNNVALATAMAAQIKVTRGALKNFSNTTVVSGGYVQAVDKAILAVQSGMTDYNSAIREAVKRCAAQGLRVVEYKSGYKRRLDSAFRQNLLDGMRDLAQARQDIIGQQIGCDGVEVSAHMLCAEDHLDVQGQQFSNEEYDIAHWALIPSNRDIGMWNCHHWLTPIMMGISPKTYGDTTLQQYKDYSREQITIKNSKGEDITRTRYQWTQEQRKLETAVRQQKDLRTAAQALGNVDGVRQANAQITKYRNAYRIIEKATGQYGEWAVRTGGGYPSNPNTPNSNTGIVLNQTNGMQGVGNVAVQTNGINPSLKVNNISSGNLVNSSNSSFTNNSNSDIISLKTTADPTRDYLGSAFESHPKEAQEIFDNLKRLGVQVSFRDNTLGYFPNSKYGNVGSFVVDKEASITALMHEEQHAKDDYKSGWSLMKALADGNKMIELESRAYDVEIEFAKNSALKNLLKSL